MFGKTYDNEQWMNLMCGEKLFPIKCSWLDQYVHALEKIIWSVSNQINRHGSLNNNGYIMTSGLSSSAYSYCKWSEKMIPQLSLTIFMIEFVRKPVKKRRRNYATGTGAVQRQWIMVIYHNVGHIAVWQMSSILLSIQPSVLKYALNIYTNNSHRHLGRRVNDLHIELGIIYSNERDAVENINVRERVPYFWHCVI